MEKELKFCTGVLLRADPTGHGHPTRFGRKGLDGRAQLGQPSKGNANFLLILSTKNMLTNGGGAFKNPKKFAYVIYECSLM